MDNKKPAPKGGFSVDIKSVDEHPSDCVENVCNIKGLIVRKGTSCRDDLAGGQIVPSDIEEIPRRVNFHLKMDHRLAFWIIGVGIINGHMNSYIGSGWIPR